MVEEPNRPEGTDRPLDPDATRPIPGAAAGPLPPDATRALPPVDDEPARWSARAGVPAPDSVRRQTPIWPEEATADPYAGRSWLTPVVVAVVALLLLIAIGVGLWLISRDDGAGPVVPPSASPSASVPGPSVAPSTEAPPSPTTPPTSAAVSTAPAEVDIPALRGDTEAEARGKLERLGLAVTVQRRVDPSLPAGRVLDTDPGAGATVPVGSTVTLIVAAPAPSSPAPSRSVAPSPSR